MKKFILLMTGITLCGAGSLFADQIYLYQEPLGAPTSYSVPFSTWQYIGVRFQANQPEQITSVHTEAAESSTGASSYFAALVHLPSVTSLPQGDPFAGGEVIYSTVFNLNSVMYTWMPLNIPFNITIDPGAYAIVLGAGSFGSGGPIDGLLHVYEKTPDSTSFGWISGGYGWIVNTAYAWDISITGVPVPEPSAIGIGIVGFFSLVSLRRKRMAQQIRCSAPGHRAVVASAGQE